MLSRRQILLSGSATLASAALLQHLTSAQTHSVLSPQSSPLSYVPVETPNGSTLPWTIEDGRKTFHLIAEPVKREFAPGMVVNCWGYNGQTPGPTIEAVEGDRLRIYVTNKLPEPTTVHWHGLILPNGMDGVAGVTQPHIPPGDTFVYEFDLKQHGTQMYHPHADEMLQMAMGMQGFFVIHPREPRPADLRIDRDFAIFLQEWFIPPGGATPNPAVMTDFNTFTFNSRVWPGTAPLIVKRGQRVRIRLANLSMDSHPIHFHGHHGWVTGTDAGPIPQSAWWPATTVNVPVGETRDIEFVADNPGDWPLHCHKNHHAMNAMSHDFPNLLGVNMAGIDDKIHNLLPEYMSMGAHGMHEMLEMKMLLPRNTLPMMAGGYQFGPVGMGGMFTLIKIRENLASYDDPGYYAHPPGSVAHSVSSGRPASTTGALYTCPMHPEVTIPTPGTCPKCGMKLVKR